MNQLSNIQSQAVVLSKDGQSFTTSIIIAEGTEIEHASVILLVRKYLDDLNEFGLVDFKSESTGGRPTEYACLNEHQSTLLLTYLRNSDIVRGFKKRLVKAFYELRDGGIPKTLPEALRLAADLAERNASLENKIQEDAPKVEFAMAVRRMEGSCKIGDFGKAIGIGRNTLFAMMRADNVLMANNMPYQRYIDLEYFVVIESTPYTDRDGKAHPAFTTMVTGKGQVWLERKYRMEQAA